MDIESFLKITSVFKNCFSIGNKTASKDRSVTFTQLKSAGILAEEEMLAMDKEFILRNLSPGGCAVLLELTYFVNSLSKGRL